VTNKKVIILGAGGHAKVVAEALRLSGAKILGFVTPDLDSGKEFYGSTILGDDAVIFDYLIEEVDLVNGVGALPGQTLRWELASKMREKGYHFKTVVHPKAVVASSVVLEEGVQVMAGVVIQPGTSIGRDSIINSGVIIDHDCVISENCHLAPGVVCSGAISIGGNTHIGTGASIIQGINVGGKSVIAAGTIIYKNVPLGTLVKQQLNILVTREEE